MSWYTRAQYYEDEEEDFDDGWGEKPEFESRPFDGICYHGTTISPEQTVLSFDEFTDEFSDYQAVWVTPQEEAAQEFADRHAPGPMQGGLGKHVPAVFRVSVNLDNVIVIQDRRVFEDLVYHYDLDPELVGNIPFFVSEGFDGWFTMGSVGRMTYEDIAVFDPSSIRIEAVKFLVGNTWTEYFHPMHADPILKSIRRKRR